MPAVILDHALWAQLEQVQLQVNREVAFTPDERAWGRAEWWEPATRTGDCEDIALAKRARLMRAGWPAEALRMAVAIDEHGQPHALLTVDVVVRGRPATYALDNRLTHVEPWRRLSDLGYRWVERWTPGSRTWASLGG